MGKQHVYSRSLAGFLFLAVLVALCGGGCSQTISEECPILEPIWSAPCMGNSDKVAEQSGEETRTISDEPTGEMAQAGVLGYSDPTDESLPTPPLTEDGGAVEQIGGTDAGRAQTVTPWMANWGKDRMDVMNKESNVRMNEGNGPGSEPSP